MFVALARSRHLFIVIRCVSLFRFTLSLSFSFSALAYICWMFEWVCVVCELVSICLFMYEYSLVCILSISSYSLHIHTLHTHMFVLFIISLSFTAFFKHCHTYFSSLSFFYPHSRTHTMPFCFFRLFSNVYCCGCGCCYCCWLSLLLLLFKQIGGKVHAHNT